MLAYENDPRSIFYYKKKHAPLAKQILEDKSIFMTSLHNNQLTQFTQLTLTHEAAQAIVQESATSSVLENENLSILVCVYWEVVDSNGNPVFFKYSDYQNHYPTTFNYTLSKNSPLDKSAISPLRIHLDF